MGREPLTNMNHLAVISSVALPLRGIVMRDSGRRNCVSTSILLYGCSVCILNVYSIYTLRRYIITLWYKVSCCIIEEDCGM